MSRPRLWLPVVMSLAAFACGNAEPRSAQTAAEALLDGDGRRSRAGVAESPVPDGTEASSPDFAVGDAPPPARAATGVTNDATTVGGAAAVAPGPQGGPADPAPPAGATAAAGPARYDSGASEKEVTFASISSLTGLFADFMQPRGARAAFKAVNAAGGVHGRKINYVIYDDQWDVTRHAALTRQAFESDEVFAFVSNDAIVTVQGGKAFVEANKIPVIGGAPGNLHTFGVSPYYFTQAALGNPTTTRIAGYWGAEMPCKAWATFVLAQNESREWGNNFRKGLQARGKPDAVYNAEISIAETDYTQYVATAKSKGVDCITIGAQASSFVRTRKAMAQQDMTAPLVLTDAAHDPAYLEADIPNEGDYLVTSYNPSTASPGWRQFAAEAARYEPGLKRSGYALMSWVAGRLAIETLKRMGDDLTREHMLSVLRAMRDADVGLGAVPPVTFSGTGPQQGPTCSYVGQVRNRNVELVRRLCL